MMAKAKEQLVTIRFLETRTVKGVDGETFEKDSVHTISETSANHWLNRNVAVRVEDAPSEPVAARTPEPEPASVSSSKSRAGADE